jgi:hypothetical protein
MKAIRDMFLYLEKTYLASRQNEADPMLNDQIIASEAVRNLSPAGRSSFWLIGLEYLRDNISQIDLKDKLISGILELIK